MLSKKSWSLICTAFLLVLGWFVYVFICYKMRRETDDLEWQILKVGSYLYFLLIIVVLAWKYDQIYENSPSRLKDPIKYRFLSARTRILIGQVAAFGFTAYGLSQILTSYSTNALVRTITPTIIMIFYALALGRKRLKDTRIIYRIWYILFLLSNLANITDLPFCKSFDEIVAILWKLLFPGALSVFLFWIGLSGLQASIQTTKVKKSQSILEADKELTKLQ